MGLSWTAAHDGAPVSYGFDGALRVGQVVFYDVARGEGPGWVGFVRGRTVTERCDDPAEAKAIVEEVYAADPRLGLAALRSGSRW